MSTERPLPGDLLAHAGFVRAMARAALRGDPECEDVEQEAWVAALEREPTEASPGKSWFAAVLRNRAADLIRRRSRRRAREHVAARPESVPATDDAVARAETGRRLVAAVLALEEPFRTAILLRYMDDMPPRAVAARLGVPVETVRSRVKRGLAQLRARLEEDSRGERTSWRRALAGVAGASVAASVPWTLLGGSLLAKKLVVAASLLLLLGAGTWWAIGRGEDRTSAPDRPDVVSGVDPIESEPGPSLTSSADNAPAAAPVPRVPIVFPGQVVDEGGNPIAGAEVFTVEGNDSASASTQPALRTVTDAEGRFRLERNSSALSLRARAPGRVMVSSPHDAGRPQHVEAGTEARLVLQSAVPVRVRVTRLEDGEPLPDARVFAFVERSYTLYNAFSVDDVTSDERGIAELAAPGGELQIIAQHEGRAQGALWGVRAAPPGVDVEIALGAGGTLRGTVVDPRGEAVASARVDLWRAPWFHREATTGPDGRFRFEHVPPPRPNEDWEARRVVVLSCETPEFGSQWQAVAPPAEASEVDVRFDLAPLEPLSLVVRWTDGTPVADVAVRYAAEQGRPEWGWTRTNTKGLARRTDEAGGFVTDPLPPGRVAIWVGDADEPTAHGAIPSAGPFEISLARALEPRRVRVLDASGAAVAKAVVRVILPDGRHLTSTHADSRTDADGYVEVGLPAEGAFTIVVTARATGPAVFPQKAPLAAPEVELRLGSGRIEGRVLRLDGTPLRTRVSLAASLPTGARSALALNGSPVSTDDDGRFRFENVSPGTYRIRAFDQGLRVLEDEDVNPDDATGVVRHVVSSVEAEALTLAAEVVDDTGAAVTTAKVVAEGEQGARSVALYFGRGGADYRSHVLAAPGAWTLRASAEGHEGAEARVRVSASGPVERPRLVLRRAR